MEKQVVVAASIPKKKVKPLELLGMFCYYYQQYNLNQARKLPYKTVKLLLEVANQQKALEYANLIQIASAARGKDGGKSLHKQYKRMAGK